MVQTPGDSPPSPCEQLLDFAYGELEGEAQAAFERHLAGCARCQAELSSIERVRGAVRAVMPMVEPPQTTMEMGALHAQLLHAAAQRKPAGGHGKVLELKSPWKRVQRVVMHPAFAAAAVFVIVGGVVGMQWKRSVEPAPMTATAPAPTPAPAAPPVAAVPADQPNEAGHLAAKEKEGAKQGEGTAAVSKDSIYLGTDTGDAYRVRGEAAATSGKKVAAAKRSADPVDPLAGLGDGDVSGGAGSVAKREAKAPAPAKPMAMPATEKPSPKTNAVGGATSPDDLTSLTRRDSNGTWNAQTRNWASPSSGAAPAAPPPPTTTPSVPVYETEQARALGKGGRAGASSATSVSTPPAGAAFGSAPSQALTPSTVTQQNSGAGGYAQGMVQQQPVRGPTDGALAKNAAEMRKKADELARTGRCDEANAIYQQLEKTVANFKLTMTERANLSHCRGQQGRMRQTQDELDSLKAAEPLEERQQQPKASSTKSDKKQRMPQSFDDAEAAPARPAPAEAPVTAAPAPAPAATTASPSPSPSPSRKSKKAADSKADSAAY